MRSKGESQNMEMEILRIQKLLSEDISDYTHSLILKFPRVERFVLCKRLEDSIANMLHLTIEAKKKYYKKTTFRDLDIEIDYFRLLIRQCRRCEYVSLHQFEVWSGLINETALLIRSVAKEVAQIEGW